jgi:putative hemolysin
MKTLLIALTLIPFTTAFASDGGGSSVGPANPAAVFCVKKLGGTLEHTVSELGGSANCVVEEWKLYRTMDEQGLVKPVRCTSGRPCLPNPASANCVAIGGAVRIQDGVDGQYGMCVVEEWTLWRVFNGR